jgi:hypothetical protein
VWASAATGVPIEVVPATLEAAAPPGRRSPFDDALVKFLSVIDLRRRVAQEIAAHSPPPPETLAVETKETR